MRLRILDLRVAPAVSLDGVWFRFVHTDEFNNPTHETKDYLLPVSIDASTQTFWHKSEKKTLHIYLRELRLKSL